MKMRQRWAWYSYNLGCQQPSEARRVTDRESSPSAPPEGTNPADTLVSDFWTPQLGENKSQFLEATQFVILCCGCPGKLIRREGDIFESLLHARYRL